MPRYRVSLVRKGYRAASVYLRAKTVGEAQEEAMKEDVSWGSEYDVDEEVIDVEELIEEESTSTPLQLAYELNLTENDLAGLVEQAKLDEAKRIVADGLDDLVEFLTNRYEEGWVMHQLKRIKELKGDGK